MATQRKARYKARVREDGSLVVEELQLVPGTEYEIELHGDLDDDTDFARLVAWETMKPWCDTPEEDEAWKHLQEEK